MINDHKQLLFLQIKTDQWIELTSWSWISFEKLIVAQIFKPSASYEIRRFITVFARTRHIMSQMNPVHTLSPNFLKIHYNIIFHLLLALPSGLFHSSFPTKILFAFSHFSRTFYIRSPSERNYKRSVEIYFDSADVNSILKSSTRLFHLFAWFPVLCAAREVIGWKLTRICHWVMEWFKSYVYRSDRHGVSAHSIVDCDHFGVASFFLFSFLFA